MHSTHEEVSNIVVNFFKDSLRSSKEVQSIPDDLEIPRLSHTEAAALSMPFTSAEIWRVLKNMAKKKCPDGFTVEFFIEAWSIIKVEENPSEMNLH